MQQAAARSRRLPEDVAREPYSNQVSFRDGGGRGQAAAPSPLGLHLPATESHANALGVSAEDQGTAGIASAGDQAAEFTGRAAVTQQFRVVDHHDAGPSERGQGFGEFRFAQFRPVE
jgi:hypothetical protein